MADLPNCPNCELARQLNPLVYYCGYDFHSGEMSPDHMVRMSFWQICWGVSGRIDRTTFFVVGVFFQIVVVSVWRMFWNAFLSLCKAHELLCATATVDTGDSD